LWRNQQLIPVGVRPGQPRHLQRQDDPGLAQAHVSDQLGEPRPAAALAPERPRSSSITTTWCAGEPSSTARCRRSYWRATLSVWTSTCSSVDWRTYAYASRALHLTLFPTDWPTTIWPGSSGTRQAMLTDSAAGGELMTYAAHVSRSRTPPGTVQMPETNDPTTPPDRRQVCRIFALGAPVGDWTVVPGARSHTMWSLTTETGRYAVKVFDRIVDDTRSAGWRQRLKDAVSLELAAWRAGLPLPRPVPVVGSDETAMLAEVPSSIGAVTIRVHEWVDANPVPESTAEPGLAAAIGSVLAGIHQLALTCPLERAVGLWHTHDDEYVASLAAQARRRGYIWAPALERA
jgi:hypothetical protein